VGKKTSKTTSTSAPPAWAVPIIQGGAQSLSNTYNQNQPGLQALQSGLTGSTIPGIQQQIGDTKQQLQPGFDYNNNVLGGQYLNSNPYTQQMAQFAGQQAGNAVNSAFSQAGRTGSGDHATDLARGVDQASNNVLFQNYQNERGLQNQSAGMLPGYTGAEYQGYSPLLAGTQLAGQLPYYGSSTLGQIGSLLGNYGKTSQQQPGGLMGGLLGAASNMFSFAPISLSDRRLKTNITLLRRAKDGLGEYTWNWKRDPNGDAVRGVIADEVKALRPHAYVPNYRDGFDGVNYAALGSME
jgi:hypothetical protein